MAKVTLNSITSGYASVDALNENFQAITDAFENTFSRNGETPNTLNTDLDLNHNDIINAGNVSLSGTITVDGEDYELVLQSLVNDAQVIYDNMLALQNVTVSTSSPSGGTDGDIWFTVSS